MKIQVRTLDVFYRFCQECIEISFNKSNLKLFGKIWNTILVLPSMKLLENLLHHTMEFILFMQHHQCINTTQVDTATTFIFTSTDLQRLIIMLQLLALVEHTNFNTIAHLLFSNFQKATSFIFICPDFFTTLARTARELIFKVIL